MKKALLLVFLLVLVVNGVVHGEGLLRVRGSDTLLNLSQTWAEEYMILYPEAMISVSGGGSGTGLAGLLNGTVDIANSSRSIRQQEIETLRTNGYEAGEFKVALDGLSVIVHPSNTIRQLSVEQIGKLFNGEITNWKEVGGFDAPVLAVSRDSSSGTYAYFLENILGGKDYRQDALLMASTSAIVAEVSQNPHSIGYIGLGYVDETIVPLRVGVKEDIFVEATIANVSDGSYPIARPLFVYTLGQPTGIAKDFIDFMYSDLGQEIVTQVGFVPVQ